MTITSGEWYSCQGTSVIHVQLQSEIYAFVVLMVFTKPLSLTFIIGMNGVSAFRAVKVMCGLLLNLLSLQK